MYVEYLGIPGCGKTFWKDNYLGELRNQCKPYLDVSRQKVMPFWLKVFYKLAETFLLKLPRYKKETHEYEEVCKGCTKEPKFLPFSMAYCIKDIVLASLLHDIFDGKIIYVNDEGQLQRLVFLVVQYGVSVEKLLQIYRKHRGEVKTIYVQTEVEKAIGNIRMRNRHVCPMDAMSDSELMTYEQEFYACCEQLVNGVKGNFEVKKICAE